MGDTLSQEEIDNLLKAFNDGDLNADDFSDTKEKQVKMLRKKAQRLSQSTH